MQSSWDREFQKRMHKFENTLLNKHGQSISIKIRVTSGCFHREHSPNAYQIIDEYRDSHPFQNEYVSFEEHESGPEILVYLALATAGLSLTKSIIDLVVTILKARSKGIKKGDKPDYPLELIVRGYHKTGELKDEKILRFDSRGIVDEEIIENMLQKAINKMFLKNKKKNKILTQVPTKRRK